MSRRSPFVLALPGAGFLPTAAALGSRPARRSAVRAGLMLRRALCALAVLALLLAPAAVSAQGAVSVSVADAAAVEGGTLAFRVVAEGVVAGAAVCAVWHSADGTATAGEDYRAVRSETPLAVTTGGFSVPVSTMDDAEEEPAESLSLVVRYEVVRPPEDGSAASCPPELAAPVAATAIGTIEDDDEPGVTPSGGVSVGGASGEEGAALVFSLVPSRVPDGFSLCVRWHTADGSAQAGIDYAPEASEGFIRVGGGYTVAVATHDDDLVEAAETFQFLVDYFVVAGSSCSAGRDPGLLHVNALGTIADNDAAGPGPGGAGDVLGYIALQVFPLAVAEPLEGVSYVNLVARVTGEPPQEGDGRAGPRPPVYVRWAAHSASAAGGASCADPRADFVDGAGEFVVQPDDLDRVGDVVLGICADGFVEGAENLLLRFEISDTPAFGRLRVVQWAVEIRDATEFPGLRPLAPPSLLEADAGDPPVFLDAVVELRRPNNADATTIVYGTELISGSAVPGVDYEGHAGRTVVPAGRPGAVVRFAEILADGVPEPVELFTIWAHLEGRPETRVTAVAEISDDDVAIHGPGFVVFDIGVPGDLPLIEGDRPKPPLPIVARLADAQLHSEAYTYRILTMDGTALAGRDFVGFDRRVRFREGELAVFDHADPLTLAVLPDLVAEEPREYFYLLVYALIDGISWPAFTAIQRVEIADDDHQEEVLDGGATLWVGGAGAEICPSPAHSVVLEEPDPEVAPWIDVAVPLAARLGPLPGETGGVCGLPSGTFEARVSLAPGADAGASVPHDVTLASRAPEPVIFAPQDHAGAVVVRVYADQLVEADETVLLLVSVGVHGIVPVELVVLDFQKRRELAAGRDAAFARLGRAMGTAVADALSDRFSCSRSAGCAGPHREAGRRDLGAAVRPSLRRLAGILRSLAPPGAPPDAAFGPPPVSGAAASGWSAMRRDVARPGPAAGAGLVNGLAFQGSPNTWFRSRNRDGDTRWTAWLRSGRRVSSDLRADQSRVRTSLLSVLGGADRRLGPVQVGALYGYLTGSYSRRFSGDLARIEDVDPARDAVGNAVSWHLVAPYAGVTPHSRVRLWTAFGLSLGSSVRPSPGYQPHPELAAGSPSYRLFAGGASLTALRFGHAVLDVDADAFDVVTRLPGGRGAGSRKLAGAMRRRVAARLGVAVDETGGRRLSVGLVRRWDAGPDIGWLSRVGSHMDSYDLVGDVRIAGRGSRVSAALSGRVQLAGAVRGAEPGSRAHRRETAVTGVLRWGHAETAEGWSIALRPAYGYPGPVGAPRGSPLYSTFLPHAAGTAFDARPLVGVEAGYGFGSGARVSVTGERGLGHADGWSGKSSIAFRFGRAW